MEHFWGRWGVAQKGRDTRSQRHILLERDKSFPKTVLGKGEPLASIVY